MIRNTEAQPANAIPGPVPPAISGHDWLAGLADALTPVVVAPVRFERHEDSSVPAVKVVGFDAQGRSCFYRHHFVVNDERFDEDELPLLVETFREQVTAWRLQDARWLCLTVRVSGFAGCGRRIDNTLDIVDDLATAMR